MAGRERGTLAWDLHCYAKGVVRSANANHSGWLVKIFGAEPGDDWTDPMVWAKSHPGFEFTVSKSFLREESMRALHSPRFADAFKRHYLNMWTSEVANWLDIGLWDAGTIVFRRANYIGKRCYLGLDLSGIPSF